MRETRCIRSMSEGYLIEDVVTTQTTKPTRQQKNAVIVGVYITQITASLAGKHAVIAEKIVSRSGERRNMQTTQRIKALDEELDCGEDSDEIYVVNNIAAFTLDDTQLVTLRLKSGNFLRFQADTGAQCNVIPLHVYKKAANYPDLRHVKPIKSLISGYGGSKLPVIGQVTLRVWRDNSMYQLSCKLVDSHDIRPILGRGACLGMNIIKYTDNDAIYKPSTGRALVYLLENRGEGMSKDNLLKHFPGVFADDVGQLDGEYHMKVDATVEPAQHPPRRVPVTLHDRLKAKLDRMVSQEVITPVTMPTPWVSSLVVVPKKDGRLRLCLDPKALNRAIQREHYQL